MGSSAAKHLCMAKLALHVMVLCAKCFRKRELAHSKLGMNMLLLHIPRQNMNFKLMIAY